MEKGQSFITKETIIYGIVGLVFGSIIGFGVTNELNRNARLNRPATDENTRSGPVLPPDHPPIPNGGQSGGAPLPQITEAIERAERNPDDYEAQMTAADLYYQIQRFADAIRFYEQARKVRPEEIEPVAKLGHANFDSEKFVEAEKFYEAVLSKTPRDINVRTDYALTFFLREPRDLDRAVREFEKSLAMDPKHELTLQNLAIVYRHKQEMDKYRRTIETLKAVNPDNPAVKEAVNR